MSEYQRCGICGEPFDVSTSEGQRRLNEHVENHGWNSYYNKLAMMDK